MSVKGNSGRSSLESLERDVRLCTEAIDVLNFGGESHEEPVPALIFSTLSTVTLANSITSEVPTFASLRRIGTSFHFTQLNFVGKKDVHIFFFLVVLGLFWAAGFWSLTLFNKQKSIPSNATVIAKSAWEAVLQFNGTFFCSNNETWSTATAVLKLNSSKDNGITLKGSAELFDKNNTARFYEVATCLGWDLENVFALVVQSILYVIRYATTSTIVIYALWSLDKLKGKQLMKKLAIIWLVAIFIFISAKQVWDMTRSISIFLIVYMYAIITVFTLILRYWSIECQVACRWLYLLAACIIGTTTINAFPHYGGKWVTQVQVFLPIILTCLDTFACKATALAFKGYRDNYTGQAICIGLYIWHMEAARFDCFLALYLGWKSSFLKFQDVCLNILFSVLGEIWTHTGIRDALEDWFDTKLRFIQLKSDFPEIRTIFSSVRCMIEWALPAMTLFIVCLLELYRDYIPVTDDDIRNQLHFFTSVRLFDYIFEIALVYYSVEVISLLLCRFISNLMDYKEISLVGSLSWSRILLLGVYLVLSQDIGFRGFMWSAALGEETSQGQTVYP